MSPSSYEDIFSPAVYAAAHRILAKERYDDVTEHRVASFAVTLVHETFQKHTEDHHWVFTPEQRDAQSNRIPDYSVEALFPSFSQLDLTPWLYMEFKKEGGHRTYKALHQLVHSVAPSLNDKCPAVYLVVLAGTTISFWELDYKTFKKENDTDIPNLWGCRSLFQPSIYPGDSDFLESYPDEEKEIIDLIKPVWDDGVKGREPENPEWKEAKIYKEKVLLDLKTQQHWKWIKRMMEHIAQRKPAAFVDPEMERMDTEMET